MFSMTTIESSMTRPMAMVRPPRVSMFRESPWLQRMISAPITLSGMERPAMMVERQLRRNTQMTMIAKSAPTIPSCSSELMLSLMKIDWSMTVVTVAWPPRSLVIDGSSSATALAMSTVLPLLDLLTEMPMDGLPFVRVTAVSGAGAILTVATSPRVTATPVTLGDVATVKIAPAPLTAVTRTNGKPSIGISVSKSSSGNTVDIANAVADELPSITKDLGGQATVTTVIDQSIFIKDSISSLLQEGIVGALFAIIVIWVFLRSWRSTIIAGLSIPLSVIGALIILWSQGDSLNMLTLGGLTIAIGRVIDDSIVVIENIYRHLQEGDSIRRAAYTGTREVAGAITASTLTTVAVFLPLGLVHGLASEFFRPFALTVTCALLCSLAVALIVVPVASTWLLSKKQVGHRDEKELTRLQNTYLPALKWTLDHKIVTIVAAVAIFLGTMSLSPLLKTNLFDSSGQNTMSVTQTMPAGTSLDATMAAASKVEAILKLSLIHISEPTR